MDQSHGDSYIQELENDNITMLIVTHQMGFASEIANRVIYLSGGKILENDTPEKVFKNKDKFWFCTNCNKIYWKGSHYEKMFEKIDYLS